MIISTVKQYNTHSMNRKRVERSEFGDGLSALVDTDRLKQNIIEILKTKGRVYGIYQKKQLVGVYIFERKENYFVQEQNQGVRLGNREFDFDKFWYGSNTAAFCFKDAYLLEELEEYQEKIEKDLTVDLKEQIEWGNVGGVEWKEQLMYRKNLQKKADGGILGAVIGFILGVGIGWIIFDTISMVLCFGVMYSVIWGSAGVAIANGPEIDTLDFVQKSEVETDATK